MADFVHLHNHSHYSLLDGACRISDLVRTCAEYEMPAIALTDHGNMFGAIEFYKTALKFGIKPIIGVESYIAPGSRFDKTAGKTGTSTSYHLVLLAKNETGFKNLMKLVSAGYLDGFYYKPRIDREILEAHASGLVALSACLKGQVSYHFAHNNPELAREAAQFYQGIFGPDFYLEVQNHGIEKEDLVRKQMLSLGKELGIAVVGTNDIHYLHQQDHQAHDVLLCLQTGKDYDDQTRMRYETDQIYFKNAQEMAQTFRDCPEVIDYTLEIADKCNLLMDFKQHHLPKYKLPETEINLNLDEYLAKLARQGLKGRYPTITADIEGRLEHELEIIKKMGFAGYFLIVKDFIDYARSQDIPVGPGRGSAAGSLVSYCVGITNIDPIRYDLLFERFLNPERVTMPDIDIDFCYERREEIINWVKQKYGEKNVTQIITFGTMAARAVIRDVGRVLKMSYSDVDRIAKMVPQTLGITLDQALKVSSELKEASEKDDLHRNLLSFSQTLEGLARHSSTHAAGVVITPSELTNYTPLYKSKEGEVTSQWDMKSLEEVGVLKMDFLGLRTLTVINDTIRALKKRGVNLDLDRLPLDDKATYDLFGRGETVGIFQFESSGMREYLKKLKPQRLEDLIAMNALYRPGPMEMIDEFINCKHGKKKITYLHPALEPILKETYGVCVYQEQVMRIASDLGGFTLGEADILRRAMGKKKVELMAEQRQRFIEGARKKGVPEKAANETFDLMDKFAGYGFNKSHAAGYSLVAYQTAFLKAHYPAEFMAANLSSEMNDNTRIMILLDDCRRLGLEVLPPDINDSQADFVVADGKIRFGLGAIKNVGLGAIDSVVTARNAEGPFTTLFDLCQRIDLRLVNKKVLESLAMAGALDSLTGHRAQFAAAIDTAIEFGQKIQGDARTNGQIGLFEDGLDNMVSIPSLPNVPQWNSTEMLAREKELLGYYISGHPLRRYEEEVRTFSTVSIDALDSLADGTQVRLGGIVAEIKTHLDRKGQTMAFLKFEDFTGFTESIIFSDAYTKARDLLVTDAMLVISGKVSTREGETPKIICDQVISLESARAALSRCLYLSFALDSFNDQVLDNIETLIKNNSGNCQVFISLKANGASEYVLRSRSLKVNPSLELITSLRNLLGQENVWLKG